MDLAAPAPARAGPADAARRLGWEAHPDEISSYETFLTYREWLEIMDHIAEQVAGRKAVVSRFDDVLPSAIYFFSNLQVVLAVEPMMSIWTRDDVERWKSKLEARDVECLVSTHDDDPVAAAVLTSFDRYSTHRVDAPIAFEIHCRDE